MAWHRSAEGMGSDLLHRETAAINSACVAKLEAAMEMWVSLALLGERQRAAAKARWVKTAIRPRTYAGCVAPRPVATGIRTGAWFGFGLWAHSTLHGT